MLLNVKQVCAVLGIARSTLYHLVDTGDFAPKRIKLGGSVKFRRDEVEAWAAAGCPAPADWSWETSACA